MKSVMKSWGYCNESSKRKRLETILLSSGMFSLSSLLLQVPLQLDFTFRSSEHFVVCPGIREEQQVSSGLHKSVNSPCCNHK